MSITPVLGRFLGPLGVIKRKAEGQVVQSLAKRLAIRMRGIEAPVNSLSGGNQQKVLLHYTAFGRLVTAIGSNQEAVRLSGISIGWYIFATYVISGGLSALAGIVNTAQAETLAPSA